MTNRIIKSPSSSAEDQTTGVVALTVLAPPEKTAAIAKVRFLEHEVLDDGGFIRRNVTPAQAEEIIALINELRRALGWLEIELDGRWRWPASVDRAITSH